MKKAKRSVADYQAMDYGALHKELLRLVKQAPRVMLMFNRAERDQLLPALLVMKEKVAQPGRRFATGGLPCWEEECELLGIKPGTVRQWKERTQSEADLRMMLGEQKRPPKERHVAPSRELYQLQQLVQAVLDGNEDIVEHLAQRFAEEYEF